MARKIIGWILLVTGLLLIAWTLIFSYNLFTGEAKLPEFFEPPEEQLSQTEDSQDVQDIEAQLQQMIDEQFRGILPAESITRMLNLAAWSVLAFIFIFGGSQIASLGIKLIK